MSGSKVKSKVEVKGQGHFCHFSIGAEWSIIELGKASTAKSSIKHKSGTHLKKSEQSYQRAFIMFVQNGCVFSGRIFNFFLLRDAFVGSRSTPNCMNCIDLPISAW